MKVIRQYILQPKKEETTLKLSKDVIFLNILPSANDKDITLFLITDEKIKKENIVKYIIHIRQTSQGINNKAKYLGSVSVHHNVFQFHIFIERV